MSSETPAPRRRSRFSLRARLVFTTFIAMAIVLAMFYKELVTLRADLRRLRNEVGELSIDDESLLHAIAVRRSDDLSWKWRLWIPKGKTYDLHYVSADVPKSGFPSQSNSIRIDSSGEMWVEYRIFRDERTNKWVDQLATSGASVGISEQRWIESPTGVSTNAGVGVRTQVFEPGKTVVLGRHNVSTTATSSDKIEDPSEGFMIWLEPVP